jgi:hypothetical protein
MSDNDATSVCSAGSKQSITNEKRECPVCNKEVNTRSLFKHIKTKHDSHWFESMYANEKMLTKYIQECEPIPFMYEEKNDFDEIESKDIYGCLACFNSFTHKGHGKTHCNKAKCKATHIKECKSLLQRVMDLKAKMLNKTDYSKWSREKLCNAIETEMRWYKWINSSYLWKILYTFYTEERQSRITVLEKYKYDFTWMHNTPNGAWPVIPALPDYDMTYNKEEKDLRFRLHYWTAITGAIHSQFVFMRWHYENKEDGEIFHMYDNERHPEGQYIAPMNAEEHINSLPSL